MRIHLNLIMVAGGFTLLTGCSTPTYTNPALQTTSTASTATAAAVPANSVTFGAVAEGTCATQLIQQTVPIKLLFVLDTSGSNSGSGGTDPGKVVREQSIEKFYTDNYGKTNFYYGMIAFSNDAAPALINSGTTASPTFSNSYAVIEAAFSTFAQTADNGDTPYATALQKVNQAIAGDTLNASTSKYIVVFMSDGQPNPAISTTTLQSDIQAIVALHPGQVSFNTVYYGSADATASARLSMMAQTGGGQFLDTNSNPAGKDFAISNIVTIPGTNCTNN